MEVIYLETQNLTHCFHFQEDLGLPPKKTRVSKWADPGLLESKPGSFYHGNPGLFLEVFNML